VRRMIHTSTGINTQIHNSDIMGNEFEICNESHTPPSNRSGETSKPGLNNSLMETLNYVKPFR
jgi:hypothetical protein